MKKIIYMTTLVLFIISTLPIVLVSILRTLYFIIVGTAICYPMRWYYHDAIEFPRWADKYINFLKKI